MTGLLLVDKPVGLTSHDVVDKIRRAAGTRRVGHTGTLDPAATGLLVLCLGQATRLSEHLTGLDKVYEGIMRLGIVTDSYDLDGRVLEERTAPEISVDRLQEACDRFTGIIAQVPPMVSAVKIGGERLYKKARKGEVVDRPPREITVHEFRILSYESPDARVYVRCTSGTYVRSLCHDVGQVIGCGAVLAALRRTHVGSFRVSDALPVQDFTGREIVEKRLVSMNNALDLPVVIARETRLNMVETGATLSPSDLKAPSPVREGWVQIKSEKGVLLALGVAEATAAGARIHPRRVFTP